LLLCSFSPLSCIFRTTPPPGFTRVDTLSLLGVLIDPCLTFFPHVTRSVQSSAQSTYAPKKLKFFGLPPPNFPKDSDPRWYFASHMPFHVDGDPFSPQTGTSCKKFSIEHRVGSSVPLPRRIQTLCERADTVFFRSVRSNLTTLSAPSFLSPSLAVTTSAPATTVYPSHYVQYLLSTIYIQRMFIK